MTAGLSPFLRICSRSSRIPVDETEAFQDALDDSDNEKALEAMKAEGVTVTELSDLDKWVEACAPMLDEYRQKGDNWNTFIDMIIELKK